ncbi:MAG: efflux RND transporter periplasmic adaptor subunit [Magnetococcales bacterium]|nr:efflux RND transporter periplasmic adaptor subunit [Magnetococcales bacterium]
MRKNQNRRNSPWLVALAWLLTPSLALAGEEAERHQVRFLLDSPHTATLSGQTQQRIVEMPTRLGTRFRKGAPIVVFDCASQRARLKEVQADLAAARVTLETKRALAKLNSAGRMELSQAEVQVQRGEALVEGANVEIARCQINAPFDGRVVELRARPHETIKQGEPLLTILNDGQLELEMVIPSAWLSWLKSGTPFSITVEETGKTLPARVESLNARIDPVSHTIRVTGRIDGETGDLVAGMSGMARFSP